VKIKTTLLAAAMVLAGALAEAGSASSAADGTALQGTLKLAPGKVSHGHYTGTYFRMLLPGTTDQYFANPQSRAPNKTYTLMRPGSDGGLQLGRYQPPPSTAFSASGNALAHRITKPETFASIQYSISTAKVDAQTGQPVSGPTLTLRANKLTGNLGAWTAEWNKIYFNQGSPKPGGQYPGLTQPVIGSYNRKTGAFAIIWRSAIIGGPFNGFTGFWHLQGKVVK
jgi:hypothetical protein